MRWPTAWNARCGCCADSGPADLLKDKNLNNQELTYVHSTRRIGRGR
nr:MAG TPA: hypothetical protein [Caudoviricetes sp.]